MVPGRERALVIHTDLIQLSSGPGGAGAHRAAAALGSLNALDVLKTPCPEAGTWTTPSHAIPKTCDLIVHCMSLPRDGGRSGIRQRCCPGSHNQQVSGDCTGETTPGEVG